MPVHDPSELKHRSVVSCFIFSAPNPTPLVALFKRSDQVRTYQYRLAPISGTIEANESPIQAAWRELKEETSLTQAQLESWRSGRPFSFEDTGAGRSWTIHPFAFLLRSSKEGHKGEEMIHLNWEHESWAWYPLAEVFEEEKFGGVPRLTESLRRVLFEMDMNERAGQALQSCLQELKTDHQSGSHELTAIALRGFRDILLHLKDDPEWWATARTAAWHIWKNGRKSMSAATLNALLAVLQDLEILLGRTTSSEDWCDSALATVDRHLAQHRLMPQRIKESFVSYLQLQYPALRNPLELESLTILTLSSSSTIRDAILDAFAATWIPHLDLRILESRPLFEGATMASSILTEFRTKFPPSSDQSLELTIHTDASAAHASKGVDFVLLGADQIASSGSVSNKTGSLPAVLSAKHVSPDAKVLVFSELGKVSEPGTEDDHEVEENDRNEVTSGWLSSKVKGVNVLEEELGLHEKSFHSWAQVRNIYFEWVPADLIDAYICEEGTFDRQQIQAESEKVRTRRTRYFAET